MRPLPRPLLTGLVLAAGALAASAAAVPGAHYAHGCDPARCTLASPTPAELAAIVGDADRLLAAYAGDSTELGRDCRALGATMRARTGDIRMLPFMWREPDDDGNLAAVTGDAHPVEPVAGAGRVHIARGFDALNPDRGLDAILQTARHEFAHLNGMRQGEGWSVDMGAELATACEAGAAHRTAARQAPRPPVAA